MTKRQSGKGGEVCQAISLVFMARGVELERTAGLAACAQVIEMSPECARAPWG